MTIDEAIKHCEEVARLYEMMAKCRPRMDYYEDELESSTDCLQRASEQRQLAEWLTELKDLQEENKVLISECDRLIKEKGELLSKVSGGDVLRICQLEDRLQVELDNSHCLEIELKEAKQLLKMAVEDFAVYGALKDLSAEKRVQNPDWQRFNKVFDVIDHQWRFADKALRLIGDKPNGI